MFLFETTIFLAAAVVAVPIFQRLGLGSVIGYLAAGAIIGPSGLGFVDEVEDVFHFAELGVVLLLFLIGLELQPARLWRMRREVFGFGTAQVVATGAVITIVALLLGLPPTVALVTGFALSLSSTAFVIQLLGERNELATTHGRAAFGILLFQDLAAIPLLGIVPLLAARTPAAPSTPGWLRLAMVLGVLAAILLAGRYLLRPIFRIVAQTRSHELSAAWALLVVVATALAMEEAGLSMALGSFVAGVLLADSEYRHEAESNIEPFKGLLLGLFFMAVGMSADLRVVSEQPLPVLASVLVLVAIKATVLLGLGRVWNLGARSTRCLALTLSQGGEFAFVIFGVAREADLLPQALAQILVVVVTLSMATTPLLLALSDALARWQEVPEERPFDELPRADEHVILAGYGRFGQIVARVLTLKRVKVTALDLDPEQVDVVRRFGFEIYYGDAARVDLLRAAGAARARLFVLAIDDPVASVRTAEVVRESFPGLQIVARARNRQHAHNLIALGVEHVVRETYASSLEAAAIALEEIGFPGGQAREAVDRFRQYDEQFLQQQLEVRDDEEQLIIRTRHFTEELEQIFARDQQAE